MISRVSARSNSAEGEDAALALAGGVSMGEEDTENPMAMRGVGGAAATQAWEAALADYIFLMHNDVSAGDEAWEPYLRSLQQRGAFQGGSAIGPGFCARKDGVELPVTRHIVGYIRVTADNLDQARSLLSGNPHFGKDGTVEVRELPRTD